MRHRYTFDFRRGIILKYNYVTETDEYFAKTDDYGIYRYMSCDTCLDILTERLKNDER